MEQKNTAPEDGMQPQCKPTTTNRQELPESAGERLQLVLAEILTPQQRRLLPYVSARPGAFTHEIARDCGIGNVPCRVSELNRRILHRFGLYLDGHPEPGHVNRFGARCSEHRWHLVAVAGA